MDNSLLGEGNFRCHLWGCLSSMDHRICGMPSFFFVGCGYSVGAQDFGLFPSRIILLMFNKFGIVSGLLFQYCQFRIS